MDTNAPILPEKELLNSNEKMLSERISGKKVSGLSKQLTNKKRIKKVKKNSL